MAFNSITDTEIETGKPVSNTTQSKIQENFEDHEERIQSLEDGGSVDYPPIILGVRGYYGDLSSYTGVLETTCNFGITITGIRIIVCNAGSSGTTECDIQKKSGVGSFSSVLTTLPSVVYTDGDYKTSTNGIINTSNNTLLAGDILRLDLTSVQSGSRGLIVRIDYTKN